MAEVDGRRPQSDREQSLARVNGCRSAGTLTGRFAPGAFAPAVGRRRSEPRGAPDRSRVLRVEAGSRLRALSSVARHGSARTSGASEVVEASVVTVENAGTLTRQGDRSERSAVKRAAHAPLTPLGVKKRAEVGVIRGCSLTSWVRSPSLDASRLGALRQEAPREALTGPAGRSRWNAR